MPELPEVEFAARSLRRWLSDKTIERARAPQSRVFRGSDRLAFQRKLEGRRLQWVERRGKYLLLAFDDDVGLLSHLGMTGKWVRLPAPKGEATHIRAELELEDDSRIAYDDQRLFGRIAVHPASELFDLPVIRALGPDPLIDGIDPEALFAKLHKTSRAVKVALMDQAVIAGLGNIQVTEALFVARIHPTRIASSLSRAEVRKIVAAIEETLEKTLADIGLTKPKASKRTGAPSREARAEEAAPAPRDPSPHRLEDLITYVEEAGSHNPFQIYRRAGEPCPRCGTTLEQMTLGGRTTAFCPKCQKA